MKIFVEQEGHFFKWLFKTDNSQPEITCSSGCAFYNRKHKGYLNMCNMPKRLIKAMNSHGLKTCAFIQIGHKNRDVSASFFNWQRMKSTDILKLDKRRYNAISEQISKIKNQLDAMRGCWDETMDTKICKIDSAINRLEQELKIDT